MMSNKEIREGLERYFNMEGKEIGEILDYGDYMVQEHLATRVDKEDIKDPKTKFYLELREEMKRRGKV